MRTEIEQLQHRGVFAPADEPALRWGILGTGLIADWFAATVARNTRQRLVAVGSRTPARAQEFAARYDIERAHGSYAAVIADDVDVIYIALTADAHCEWALAAIEAGRHVLVEKPFAMNAGEAEQMAAAARGAGVLVMEAMWTRYLPQSDAIRLLLEDGALGDIRLLIADHGQAIPADPEHRLQHAELGGGALLDLGVYPVSFASMVLGTPAKVTAVSDPAFTGVDATTSMLMQYAGGAHAMLTATLTAAGPTTAAVIGTDARVVVDGPFYTPAGFTLTRRDGTAERFDRPVPGRGLRFEAAEVVRCLREGRRESDVLPLHETVSVMATLDEVRRQIGLTYPPPAQRH